MRKVLRFRKRLEKERRLKFHAFDAKEEFASALRGLLGKWRRDHEDGCVVRRGSQIGGASLRPIPSEAGELGSPTEAPDGPNRTLIDHAWSLANEGKLTNAETLFAKAISRGDDPEAFRSYGAFLLRLGRRALAGVMFERIVELAGEPPGLWHAIAYGNLGLLRELSGDLVQAEQYQRKSLQIHEQRGARDRIATVHLNLGIIAKRRGQFSVAEAEFREAAALALEIGREETVSQAYNNLGILYRSTGDPHRARQMHREALAIADRLELHQQVTTACTNLGIACTEIGELSTAREMFGRALSISQQIGFEEAIAFCLAGIGRIHLIEEQPELALASLLDALQTIRRLDRSDATANILVNLAAVYGRLGKMLEATRHMQEAFDISRAIPDPLGEALAAFNLGALHHATGDDRVAREMWTIARDRYARLGLTQQVADVDSRLKSLE